MIGSYITLGQLKRYLTPEGEKLISIEKMFFKQNDGDILILLHKNIHVYFNNSFPGCFYIYVNTCKDKGDGKGYEDDESLVPVGVLTENLYFNKDGALCSPTINVQELKDDLDKMFSCDTKITYITLVEPEMAEFITHSTR